MPKNLHKGSLFLGDYADIVRVLSAANPDAADQFCEAIEHAIEHAIALLAEHPELGVKAGFRHAPQVRRWVIQKFPNYLLFYQSLADDLILIRLLHGARELPPLIPPP